MQQNYTTPQKKVRVHYKKNGDDYDDDFWHVNDHLQDAMSQIKVLIKFIDEINRLRETDINPEEQREVTLDDFKSNVILLSEMIEDYDADAQEGIEKLLEMNQEHIPKDILVKLKKNHIDEYEFDEALEITTGIIEEKGWA